MKVCYQLYTIAEAKAGFEANPTILVRTEVINSAETLKLLLD
jgi:hypothetical protein